MIAAPPPLSCLGLCMMLGSDEEIIALSVSLPLTRYLSVRIGQVVDQ